MSSNWEEIAQNLQKCHFKETTYAKSLWKAQISLAFPTITSFFLLFLRPLLKTYTPSWKTYTFFKQILYCNDFSFQEIRTMPMNCTKKIDALHGHMTWAIMEWSCSNGCSRIVEVMLLQYLVLKQFCWCRRYLLHSCLMDVMVHEWWRTVHERMILLIDHMIHYRIQGLFWKEKSIKFEKNLFS